MQFAIMSLRMGRKLGGYPPVLIVTIQNASGIGCWSRGNAQCAKQKWVWLNFLIFFVLIWVFYIILHFYGNIVNYYEISFLFFVLLGLEIISHFQGEMIDLFKIWQYRHQFLSVTGETCHRVRTQINSFDAGILLQNV